MDRQWLIRQQLELLSSPTSVQYHRIETYSSIVEGVRRVRRVLANDWQAGDERLIHACSRNDIEAVKWLLETVEVDGINLRKGINRSLLHEAVLHKDGRALVRLLYQHGADPQQRDSLGRTPLHYAASCGHLDVLIDLFHFSQVSISTLVDMEGRCPLMYACGEGHLAVCQWLIEHGNADYHRQDDRRRSCLIYACRSGHVDIVRWLLPILPSQPTGTGWYPLHFACSVGHLDVVKILLQHDDRTGHVISNTGHSALFMAMHSTVNSMEMSRCLLNSHPSVHLTTQDIEDFSADPSMILLLAQRRHSLPYLLELIERIDYPLPFIHLLLLSEHKYCPERLRSIPHHQSFIRQRMQNPLKLKQIIRCLIRKSIDTSDKIDLLEINDCLKKFIRFECLY